MAAKKTRAIDPDSAKIPKDTEDEGGSAVDDIPPGESADASDDLTAKLEAAEEEAKDLLRSFPPGVG